MYNLWLMSQMQISHFETHSECSGHKVSRLHNFAYFLTYCSGIENEKMCQCGFLMIHTNIKLCMCKLNYGQQ